MIRLNSKQYNEVLSSYVDVNAGHVCLFLNSWIKVMQKHHKDKWYSFEVGTNTWLMTVPQDIEIMIVMRWPDVLVKSTYVL